MALLIADHSAVPRAPSVGGKRAPGREQGNGAENARAPVVSDGEPREALLEAEAGALGRYGRKAGPAVARSGGAGLGPRLG
jgi:hypothetical protein